MSDDNIENLPSIDDYLEESTDLPSVEEFIEEEPITMRANDPGEEGGFSSAGPHNPDEKEEEEEELEEEVSITNLTEVLRLISDVRGIFQIFLKLKLMMRN